MPLDEAIAQSIQATVTEDRMKRFYTSIIIVGGGALLPGINQMLEERYTCLLIYYQYNLYESRL
jgi:actin-related protein 8